MQPFPGAGERLLFFMVQKPGELTEHERALYGRNMLLEGIGEAGQIKLLESRVLVVGLGGLGSPALYYLAAAGIGEIGMVDSDRVDVSNLQRQILHGHEDIGRQKTLSAQESIARLRRDIRLQAYPFRLTEANAAEVLASYDFVIEATDNFKSKFLINDVCVHMGKAFSHAGILGMYGQTMTVVPGSGPCFRCVFGDEPDRGAVKTTDEVGVLGTVAGIIGTIQATEAIKYLLGLGDLLVGRLLSLDAVGMHFREIKLPPQRRCGVCFAKDEKGE